MTQKVDTWPSGDSFRDVLLEALPPESITVEKGSPVRSRPVDQHLSLLIIPKRSRRDGLQGLRSPVIETQLIDGLKERRKNDLIQPAVGNAIAPANPGDQLLLSEDGQAMG